MNSDDLKEMQWTENMKAARNAYLDKLPGRKDPVEEEVARFEVKGEKLATVRREFVIACGTHAFIARVFDHSGVLIAGGDGESLGCVGFSTAEAAIDWVLLFFGNMS